jgi:hypothetical protein
MTTVATMRQLVITQIPEANDMLIDRVLIEVAREFCTKTRVLRRNVTETVTASTLNVTLTPPTDTELVDIVSATLDDNRLERKTTAQLDAINPKWRTEAGNSDYITLSDDLNDVLVAPLSQTTYASGLVVRGSWRPVLGATTFDDRLVSDYSDALLAGAYGRLYSVPNQPWADGNLAGFYMRSYLGQMAEAKQSATDSNMAGVVRKVRYGGL